MSGEPDTTDENKVRLEKAEEEEKKAREDYKEWDSLRNKMMALCAVVVVVAWIIAVYLYLVSYRTAGFIVGLFALLATVIATALFFLMKAGLSHERAMLEAAMMRRNLLEAGSAREDPGGAFLRNLVSITLENQSKNYRLVHTQADKSFWATLAVSIAGFLLIGLGVYYGSRDTTTAAAYIGGICGSITEFIAGVFFYLYNKTIRQLREYHKSLVSLQNVLLCLQLVQQTEGSERGKLLSKVIDSLLAGPNVRTSEGSGEPSINPDMSDDE
jgi:hypothetical protein